MKNTVLFSCSGASDVGALTDQVARKLTRDGKGQMLCMTAVGTGVKKVLHSASKAEKILAIDGCPHQCASKTLKAANFSDIKQIVLSDLNLRKGETELNDQNMQQVINTATTLLQETPA
ncbi:putative zinc-binding protein [Kiritimatiellota bacterium B12222]|nr:putative zinc-binding protein [Kiritimatiellota bacterium B12222]